MIDKETERNGRFVDGKLCCKVEGTEENIFEEDSARIKAIQKMLEDEQEKFSQLKLANILPTFRSVLQEFDEEYNIRPTLVLMNYSDLNLLCEAYNKETKEKELDRPSVGRWDSDKKRIVDDVHIKQGCDQEPGQIRLYHFES